MKKTTKSAKPAAPQVKSVSTPPPAAKPTKSVKPTATKAVAPAKPVAPAKVVAPKPPASKPLAASPVAKPAPAPLKPKPKAAAKPAPVAATASAPVTTPLVRVTKPVTTIIASIDVGFGNTLYIRGEGPGLSWGRGVPLECLADDRWSIELHGVESPILFKLLLNDVTWSEGENHLVEPGASFEVTPLF